MLQVGQCSLSNLCKRVPWPTASEEEYMQRQRIRRKIRYDRKMIPKVSQGKPNQPNQIQTKPNRGKSILQSEVGAVGGRIVDKRGRLLQSKAERNRERRGLPCISMLFSGGVGTHSRHQTPAPVSSSLCESTSRAASSRQRGGEVACFGHGCSCLAACVLVCLCAVGRSSVVSPCNLLPASLFYRCMYS